MRIYLSPTDNTCLKTRSQILWVKRTGKEKSKEHRERRKKLLSRGSFSWGGSGPGDDMRWLYVYGVKDLGKDDKNKHGMLLG